MFEIPILYLLQDDYMYMYMYLYLYMYMCMCMCMCIYIYTYILRLHLKDIMKDHFFPCKTHDTYGYFTCELTYLQL